MMKSIKIKKTFIPFITSLSLPMIILACGDGEAEGPVVPDTPSTSVEDVVSVKSDLRIDLSADKAVYNPGERVRLKASQPLSGLKVRYMRGADMVGETTVEGDSWEWTPPADDFTGYLVCLVREEGDKSETVMGTIAVDVSSDWKRFPRYGFVATFDASKLQPGVIEKEMAFLNRCHINGVQFQDWHYKHHWPLGGTPGDLMATYTDIANREVVTDVVRKYIDVQHGLGMKSIFYNLCFGVLDDGAADGVRENWYLYKTDRRGEKDRHTLPSSWKSDIYLVDPANREWQEYIGKRNDDVYASLPFDGYQIDQLGDRGTLYDYNGRKVNLPTGYKSFIKAMKTRHPEKRLVMNSVSSFGASQIAGSGEVDFCYNELWNEEDGFADLHSVIKANDAYSGGTLPTVFAAYMNYDYAGRNEGKFNNPGVIMADAVMMALGGSHLELGDHMLSREYFPAAPLAMDEDLKAAMIRYYDFMTAYQNLLRGTDTSSETVLAVDFAGSSNGVKVASWPPRPRTVTSYARKVGDRTVVSLLNFSNTDDMGWRDLNADRKAPQLLTSLPLTIKVDRPVSKVWTASPDLHGGAPVELPFSQKNGTLTFTLPSLLYWDMIVIE